MRKLGQHNVDRVFEEGLADAEVRVSGRVWSGIAGELEKDKLRRAVMWYRAAAVAAVALLMGVGAWALAWQGGNVASGGFAAGHPLRPWDDCLPSQGELRLAEAQAPATPSRTLAAAARSSSRDITSTPLSAAMGRATQGGLLPSLRAAAGSLRSLKQQQLTPSKLAPRGANLMPVSSAKQVHKPQAFVIREQGPFAALLPEKNNKRRPEREFSYDVEDAPEELAQRHWELGAGFAPDMALASTTPVQQFARSSQIIADDPLKANTNRLSPVVAYSTGIKAAFAFNDRWAVRTGLSVINRNTSTTETVNTAGKVDAYQSTLDLTSLEIPVSVRYNIVDTKHIEYFVTSGVSGNFLLHYDNEQVTSRGTIAARRSSSTDEIMKPSAANVLFSTGVSYRLLDRLNLQLEPGMRLAVQRNEYAFSQSDALSLNLMTGLNYRF